MILYWKQTVEEKKRSSFVMLIIKFSVDGSHCWGWRGADAS